MAEHESPFSPLQLSNTSEDESCDHNALTSNGDHGASGWSCPHHHKPPPSSAAADDDNDYQLLPPPQKKPRGRPVGSKNKPKSPIIITQDHEELLKPVVIKVAIGFDVMESLIEFARKRKVGISVLSGSGSISSVTLHYPLLSSPSFTLHGPFTLLSLTGTYFSGPSHPSFPSFTHGQIFGGVVAGKIVAGSIVTISATVFKNPEIYKVGFHENDEGGDVGEENHRNLNANGNGSISNFVNPWGQIHYSTRPRNY
ncbi:unnamed protein product [Lupinus luteus]|uniref:PPC domain-containing protein n=1 Tax=Lupinus luteus TaxID=3873 RepID=A0AAV1Y8Y9_LUPLU